MTNLRPVFVPPRPPNICVGCGDETHSLSLHRVCGRCETVCAACARPTGMLRSNYCYGCRPRTRGR